MRRFILRKTKMGIFMLGKLKIREKENSEDSFKGSKRRGGAEL